MDFSKEAMAGSQVSFGLAARLVQQEPDELWIRTCIEEELFSASPFGMDDPAVVDGLKRLSAWCDSAREDVPQSTGAIKREWLRLFVGLGTPQAPVWESFYVEPNATMFGGSTLEVRAAYRAWGLEFERKAHEPDDSLGIMLAFCSCLMEIENRSASASAAAVAMKASSALEDFLVKHMLPWASAWRFLVREHARTDYYRGVGELVFGLQRAYARRFGIEYRSDDGVFSYIAHSQALATGAKMP